MSEHKPVMSAEVHPAKVTVKRVTKALEKVGHTPHSPGTAGFRVVGFEVLHTVVVQHRGPDGGYTTVDFAKKMDRYTRALRRAGFVVDRLVSGMRGDYLMVTAGPFLGEDKD